MIGKVEFDDVQRKRIIDNAGHLACDFGARYMACAHGIDSKAVTNIVEISYLSQIINETESTKGVDRLILRSLNGETSVSTVSDCRQPAAGEEAAVTSSGLNLA